MKGNISATRAAIFGNVSTDPELFIFANPANGFQKAPCSCKTTRKQNHRPQKPSVSPFSSPRRNSVRFHGETTRSE